MAIAKIIGTPSIGIAYPLHSESDHLKNNFIGAQIRDLGKFMNHKGLYHLSFSIFFIVTSNDLIGCRSAAFNGKIIFSTQCNFGCFNVLGSDFTSLLGRMPYFVIPAKAGIYADDCFYRSRNKYGMTDEPAILKIASPCSQ
jgi:hypothetical protein